MYKYNPSVVEKVNKYLYGFSLNEEGYFTESDADYLVSSIPETEKFGYETGATKCVIIPEGEDYVIKIPFNGYVSSCSCCEEEDPYECNRSHCPYVAIENGGGRYCDDYCAREMELYEEVVEKYPEFKNFFLPIENIMEVGHYPIYVQAKGEIYSEIDKEKHPVQEKSVTEVKSEERNFCSANVNWLAKCLEDLNNDTELYDRFIQMLKDNRMAGDLHSSNIGYYNNHAVIIDYGGFFEN